MGKFDNEKRAEDKSNRKYAQPKTDKGEAGEKEPKGASAADTKAERKVSMAGGVGLGKADKTGVALHGVGRDGFGKHDGNLGEFKGGSKESTVYEHKREPHDQNAM